MILKLIRNGSDDAKVNAASEMRFSLFTGGHFMCEYARIIIQCADSTEDQYGGLTLSGSNGVILALTNQNGDVAHELHEAPKLQNVMDMQASAKVLRTVKNIDDEVKLIVADFPVNQIISNQLGLSAKLLGDFSTLIKHKFIAVGTLR